MHYQTCYQNMLISGYTAIFMESKNFEVQPIGLSDITDYFLAKYKVSASTVVYTESQLRKYSGFENESSTLFDCLMWYIKAWKF